MTTILDISSVIIIQKYTSVSDLDFFKAYHIFKALENIVNYLSSSPFLLND